jgi:hypothetical protein
VWRRAVWSIGDGHRACLIATESFDSKAVLIRIIDRASFRSSGWIVVRHSNGRAHVVSPGKAGKPVNARLGPPCADPQHRVATITGRRGFQPGGLVASGEIKKEGTHRSGKPQPPEVDTAKTHRQTFRAWAGRCGDTPQHRIIGSVLPRPFFASLQWRSLASELA